MCLWIFLQIWDKKIYFSKDTREYNKRKNISRIFGRKNKKRDTNMAFEYSRDERWAATRRKSFNVEKRASLLTQRRSNQLHARATEWQWRRFLSIIKPDTEPFLISAADLINHERPRYICICVCVCPLKSNKTFLQAHYTRQFEARASCRVFSFTLLTSRVSAAASAW